MSNKLKESTQFWISIGLSFYAWFMSHLIRCDAFTFIDGEPHLDEDIFSVISFFGAFIGSFLLFMFLINEGIPRFNKFLDK